MLRSKTYLKNQVKKQIRNPKTKKIQERISYQNEYL